MNTITELNKQSLDESQVSSLSVLKNSLVQRVEEVNEIYNLLKDITAQLQYIVQMSEKVLDVIANQIMASPTSDSVSFMLISAWSNLNYVRKQLKELSAKLSVI